MRAGERERVRQRGWRERRKEVREVSRVRGGERERKSRGHERGGPISLSLSSSSSSAITRRVSTEKEFSQNTRDGSKYPFPLKIHVHFFVSTYMFI